ncbi:hypothetical protein AB0J14_04940 [Micromonospora arborensis]|uniref:hypothetical protein n=1 Tax=Micromonospora arborensis TaxID=2116518 RepID=UPI0033F5546D
MTSSNGSNQWAARKAVGDDHEHRIARELELRLWTVAPYGQGVLPDSIRRALGTTESQMRWDPDLVACQGSTLALIDGKCSMRGEAAHTFTVSRKALRAHVRMWAERDLPIYYVFANMGVATPAEVLQFCRLSSVGEAGGYVSFPAGLPRPFDEVFGPPPGERWGQWPQAA